MLGSELGSELGSVRVLGEALAALVVLAVQLDPVGLVAPEVLEDLLDPGGLVAKG